MTRRSTRATRTAARRRRRRRRNSLLAALTVLGLGAGGTAVLLREDESPARAAEAPRASSSRTAPAPPAATTKPPPTSTPPTTAPVMTVPATTAPGRVPVPADGPGTFTRSRVGGERQGRGPVRTYRIEVEDGIELDPDETARTVASVLGHPRGWTRNPAYGFRLVASGPVDFTIRIATPGTTDRLCYVTTPASKGNVNCRIDHAVVVNLKLWVRGSPRFDGPIEEYRALIVNHEVGHEIGRGHETCPGPGQPAPAMMQQIKGLLGCVANAWPYDGDGRYVQGPPVP
ncbi:DUF3152 domain-containing protein [Streptomyces sp. NPDC058486]|uniref:DUF3152 domain-containing protein n=1 Tax=unclassified Streptomyces TaxID=2593676 RepID=UPI0036698B12